MNMHSRVSGFSKAVPAAALLFLTLPVMAAVPEPSEQTTAPANASFIDPDAIEALDGMGKALRTLERFTLETASSIDVVLETGQKVQLDGRTTYLASRPDKLYVKMDSDRKQRQIFFDGRSLTVYSPKLKYYATVETRAHTLGELVTNAATDYGISLPLADLFFWGTEELPADALTSALYIGTTSIDGQKTEHYAFRQAGVDWQVWLARDSRLPRQIVITNVEDPAMPEFRARLNWDTTSPISASSFQFKAPKDAASIVMALPAATTTSDKK